MMSMLPRFCLSQFRAAPSSHLIFFLCLGMRFFSFWYIRTLRNRFQNASVTSCGDLLMVTYVTCFDSSESCLRTGTLKAAGIFGQSLPRSVRYEFACNLSIVKKYLGMSSSTISCAVQCG